MTDFGREYEDGYFFGPTTGRPIEFKDPEAEGFSAERRQQLIDVVGRFEAALYGPQSTDPQAGWRAHLDERSAVDHAIVQEALKNQDAFSSSFHFYKQENAGLFFGPVWDFDIAAGNSIYGKSAVIPGWMGDDHVYAGALYDDPAFARAFAERWRRLRAGGFVEKMLARIDRWERLLQGEQQRNFRRWKILGKYVTPNPVDPATGKVRQTYREEVDFLRSWLRERAAWIDANVDRLGQ